MEEKKTAFNNSMVAGLDFPVDPPQPTVRSVMPYFPDGTSRFDALIDEEVIDLPIHNPDLSGSKQRVFEEDGIPLLAETVVPGTFVAQGQDPQENQLPSSLMEDLEGTEEALEVEGSKQAEADEEVEEDPFVDPFDESGDRHVAEELRDPWEPWNTSMFKFNQNMDRYVLKPIAMGYNFVIPPDMQNSLANAFSNMAFAPKFLNNVFQGKFSGAGIETQRFLINTIMGVGGLFDVALYVFDIEAPDSEDFGQTLAVRGVGSGPYLILPFLPPTTVRDLTGIAGEAFMNPINYFIPLIPNLAINVGDRVNERSINLESFEGIEESTVDLYGAVRSGYFDRRERQILE